MSNVNPSQTKLRKYTAMIVVVGVSMLSVSTLAGQGPFAPANGPLDLILQKLDALAEAVESLTPTPPGPSEVTLRTSAVPIRNDAFLTCNWTNVSTSPIAVTAKLLNGDGVNTLSPNPPSPLAPGATSFAGIHAESSTRRCEFTFTGFADDIRANMTIEDNDINNPMTPVSAVFEAR